MPTFAHFNGEALEVDERLPSRELGAELDSRHYPQGPPLLHGRLQRARLGRFLCVLGLTASCTATTHHSFQGSFSAGSKPIFATKASFCSIFRDLPENHLLASKFCKILAKCWQNLQNFENF